jgi:hypothetical protein
MAFLGSRLNSGAVYYPSRQLGQRIVAGWILVWKGIPNPAKYSTLHISRGQRDPSSIATGFAK